MLLHALDTADSADSGGAATPPLRTALLLHGAMGSAESWWRVIPLLVDRGYRVLALDLPGHGRSPRDPQLTVDEAAAAVVETIRRLAPEGPLHAVGHSYGATVLAAAAAALDPSLTVYVDAALSIEGGHDRAELVDRYECDRLARVDADALRRSRPFYSERDAEVEARAAERFDPETLASVSCGTDGEWPPAPGSIVVRAEPSSWVSDADVRRLTEHGVDVRSIPGAAHTVWYSHFEEFTASLPELFGGPAVG
ncbi:alpha/beta hydrolase family protein [Microbacterium sp. LWH10-1.2]|uniref:alpha/beta fold hydrolase n=1 Tax=unclassified Microbacterium TaxID=2609290 RepID=UPI003138A235